MVYCDYLLEILDCWLKFCLIFEMNNKNLKGGILFFWFFRKKNCFEFMLVNLRFVCLKIIWNDNCYYGIYKGMWLEMNERLEGIYKLKE